VVFADVVDFTPFTERTAPERVVGVLDEIFSAFDLLAERLGLEKIKTVGDAYMVVAGLPEPRADHAESGALAMQAELGRLRAALNIDLTIRVGMASGPVIAGVIGRRKFIYDLWGDTVNTASRMESTGLPGRIQVTEAVFERLCSVYDFEPRGEVEIKGKGRLRTYLLTGRRCTGPAVAAVCIIGEWLLTGPKKSSSTHPTGRTAARGRSGPAVGHLPGQPANAGRGSRPAARTWMPGRLPRLSDQPDGPQRPRLREGPLERSQ
jgi:class 3 adenylate cyclase